MRLPKTKKNKAKSVVIPVTQEDFYLEGVHLEEQAERWALSDVKKTLRFYVMSFLTYDRALKAPESTVDGMYNVYYNQTRLLVKIYTDYTANDGCINLLKYVNLDDLDGISCLLLPLPSIIERFQIAMLEFGDRCTWDFYFNLLTCYLCLIENEENLTGEQIVDVYGKFIEISQNLIQQHLEELEGLGTIPNDNDDNANFEHESQSKYDVNTGAGIKLNSPQSDTTEFVEMQDGLTPETLFETLFVCAKYIAAMMETLIETSDDGNPSINQIQRNFLEDGLNRYLLHLHDIVSTVNFPDVDTSDFNLALRSIQGLKMVASGDLSGLDTFLSSSNDDVDVLLSDVDIIEVAITTFQQDDQRWKLRTTINSTLSKAQALLSTRRSAIVSGELKNMENELSPTIFKLCDVLITRSDNELYRSAILNRQVEQAPQTPNDSKTHELLQKNARVLLSNAAAIAQSPCGFREYVTDKLKRNYIYGQAYYRLEFLTKGIFNETVSEIIQEHEYYASMRLHI